MVPCLAVIGHIIGRLSLTRSMHAAMVMSAAALIVSIAAALLFSWGLGLATVLLTLLTAFFSVFSSSPPGRPPTPSTHPWPSPAF